MEYIVLFYCVSVVVSAIVLFHNRNAVKQETVKAAKEALTEAGYIPSHTLVSVYVALSVAVVMTTPIINTAIGWKGMGRILNHQ
jgi:diacylglycerol kinase